MAQPHPPPEINGKVHLDGKTGFPRALVALREGGNGQFSLTASSYVIATRIHIRRPTENSSDFHFLLPGSILTRPGLALAARVFCSGAVPFETPRWPLALSSTQVVVSAVSCIQPVLIIPSPAFPLNSSSDNGNSERSPGAKP